MFLSRSRATRTLFTLFSLATTVWTGKATAAQLSLNWTDASNNEAGFKIERKAGTTGTFAQIATVGENTALYADTTVTGGATYCYRVRAYNAAGDSAYTQETSQTCGVASADTQAPLVLITAPANGATVSGSTVTVTASASDNVEVVGVQFRLDGVNLGAEDTSAPYSATWNTTAAANGPRSLTAIARDAAGNATTSTAATVTVSNTVNFTLIVNKTGTGSGTVSNGPAGISCGSDCTEAYPSETVVTLTAAPAAGSTFANWSGDTDCSDGSVTMTAAKTCTATFNLLPPTTYSLTVTKAGTGTGTVSGTGLNCGADCSESYTANTVVTLTATPASGSTFAGWSGRADCSDGSVTMTAAKTCIATFNAHMNVRIGVFRPSTGKWYLDHNGNGVIDDCANGGCPTFGQQGDLPLAGDWLGNGTLQLGVFNAATRQWRLDRNANDVWEGCTIDLCSGPFWQSTDLPVVGRWTSASPKDSIGIYRPSKRFWRLDANANGLWNTCTTDKCWSFGNLSGLPVVGDWTGGGTSKLGVFAPATGQWKLDRDGDGVLDSCTVDGCVGPFGVSGDRPVAGDWNGTGQAKIGVFDPVTGMWELDRNGNGTFDGCSVDSCLGPFGQQGDIPVVGKW